MHLTKLMPAAAALLLVSGHTYAGAHGGAPVSDLDNLPVRSGDWSYAETARGREQLVRAFDAGWIRVIDSGKIQEILKTEPENDPGAAEGFMVRLADCLPQPEIAPFPDKPVGMFKDILETGVIRQIVQGVPSTPANTSYYFSGVSQKFQDAVLEEIEKHYGVKLKVESVVVPPGRLPITEILNAGQADFVSQLNATGGNSQGMRRRTSRRFSCTMSASSQFIHIPNESKLVDDIKNLNDLIARPDVSICAGPLTTQTAQAFMPKHTVRTIYINDLTGCDRQVKKGNLDVIINPLPDLSIAGLEGYQSVHTLLVAGTPLWVAAEDIACRPSENPKEEAQCFELDAP